MLRGSEVSKDSYHSPVKKIKTIKNLRHPCNLIELSTKQAVWPPDSADTACPRLPVMTQVQHFVSRMKKGQRIYRYAITSVCI